MAGRRSRFAGRRGFAPALRHIEERANPMCACAYKRNRCWRAAGLETFARAATRPWLSPTVAGPHHRRLHPDLRGCCPCLRGPQNRRLLCQRRIGADRLAHRRDAQTPAAERVAAAPQGATCPHKPTACSQAVPAAATPGTPSAPHARRLATSLTRPVSAALPLPVWQRRRGLLAYPPACLACRLDRMPFCYEMVMTQPQLGPTQTFAHSIAFPQHALQLAAPCCIGDKGACAVPPAEATGHAAWRVDRARYARWGSASPPPPLPSNW